MVEYHTYVQFSRPVYRSLIRRIITLGLDKIGYTPARSSECQIFMTWALNTKDRI